ncbi:MAG TPA: hypothetical protein VGT05_00085 [Patescibacteria group bacterium]|nr:hypothetical protein [Patescibacteria group bacterium]
MNGFLQKLSHFFRKENFSNLFYWAIIFCIFFINTFHESYPDEFDNILGGWYILHGRLPYVGFFTHHGPVAYFIAALVVLFSGQSFVRFRIVYAVLLFLYTLFVSRFLIKSIGKEIKNVIFLFVGILALSATYYWFHMLLADSVSAFLLLPSIALLSMKAVQKKSLTIPDVIFLSVSTTLAVLCSLTYIYLVLCLYLFAFILYFRNEILFNRRTVLAIGIIIVPYILFGLYLVITRSFSDYYYDAFVFNQKYYIYNYPRPAGITTINPLRFAIVIAHDFFDRFFALLVQVRDFNFSYPANITFAIADVTMAIYLISKRKFLVACFFILFCTYANGRSNPLTSGETDYQSAVYIFISLFAICFLFVSLLKEISKETESAKKFIYQFLFIPLALYSLFLGTYFFNKFGDKFYGKYMGTAPLIYDRPQVAPIINLLLKPTDYVWVGPFEFEELFYTNVAPASRYDILNPGMGESDRISQGQVTDIETTKPKIVWYNPNFYILGRKPADYAPLFNTMLARDYVTLYDYRDGKTKYISAIPITQRVDLEKYLYIRKENVNEIVRKLLADNLVVAVSIK